VHGSVPFDFAIVEHLHFVSASKPSVVAVSHFQVSQGSVPSPPEDPCSPCATLQVRRRAPVGRTLGFTLPSCGILSTGFLRQPRGTCALCESAIGLCIFCRLHCWRGGCVGNFYIDHLHILAEISDLLRQFWDVCLQIINASSQLQHDLGPNRSAAA